MRFIFYFVLLRWFFRILFYAASDPVETLFVAIEGDVSGLLDDIDEGVDKSKKKLGELDGAGKKSGQGLKSSAGIAGAAFGLAAGAAGILLNAIVSIGQAAISAFANMASGAVQANAQFETFAIQFETLLGSGSLAQERLEELAKFGVETPFELPEVVEASRTLQTFGGTALATGDNLRMIGDIAAGVNQPFQDVAFWIGRMFDALQNGQPFGEASTRLQEMGALAGDARRQMEAMQKAGEDGAEIFGFFSEQVGGRFAGNMERLSKTFQGVTSNLEDFRGNLLRVGGQPFFEEVRESAVDFLALLSENEGTIEDIAVGIGEIGASIVRFVRKGLFSIDVGPILEGVKSFIESIKAGLGPLLAFVKEIGRFVGSLKPLGVLLVNILKIAFFPLVNALSSAKEGFSRLDEVLVTAAKGTAIITAIIAGLTETIKGSLVAIGGMGKALGALLTGNLKGLKNGLNQANDGIKQLTEGGAAAFKESMLESAKSIDAMVNPLEEVTEEVKGLDKAMSDAADTAEQKPLLDPAQLEKFGDQLDEAVQNRAKKQAELEQASIEKINKIVADGNEKRLGIDKKFNEALTDLAQDSEDKRAQVIQDTRQELADLGKSTDQQIASRRSEFNKGELRQTEDHLKAMRQLQDDFLFNLDDAVRDRDAGAIVDLQRQFKRESSQREEDFSIGQSRQGQDFNKELAGIRENEASRREELLTAQATELDNITKFEDEKRLDLETRRQEEQEKLGENLRETLQKENDNFIARQAALDEALQKQLESIAKNLADQKDVTEEGAREILETFDKFFGIGGDIDKLMEDFARKRKIRADITVAFQGTAAPTAAPQTPAQALASGGTFGGRQRLGGVQEFIGGGTLVAQKPTLAMFGETPEIVQFTPMSQLSSPGQSEPGRMIIELTGSAPPGVGAGERDQIAAVLLTALQDSGALN